MSLDSPLALELQSVEFTGAKKNSIDFQAF